MMTLLLGGGGGVADQNVQHSMLSGLTLSWTQSLEMGNLPYR
jgi:hypothetical protein